MNIKDARKAKSLTLRAFSEKIGMPVTDLSEIESGRREPTLEERKLIELEIGPFTTNEFDKYGIGMLPPGICEKNRGVAKALMENNVKNNEEMFNFFKKSYEDDLKKMAETYSDINRMSDLYQRFISAHTSSLREDQSQRIAKLKVDMIILAKTVLKNCPENRYTELCLEHIESALDLAIKSIKVEQYTNPPKSEIPEDSA